MTIPIQLSELIPVETPLGTGYAIIFEAGEHDNYWTIALDETQAIVTFTQSKLRICKSYTHERGIDDAQMREIIKQ